MNPSFEDWLNNSEEPEGPKEPEKFWFLCSNNKESAIIYAAYHEDSLKMSYPEGGKWTSRSGGGCKTREELIEKNQLLEDCRECHTAYFSTHWLGDIGETLIKEHICFGCQFWREKVEIKDSPSCFRIKGEHYQLGGEGGFGGREFSIKKADGEIIKTNKLWSQGSIPEHFKGRLPDNAEFVKTPEAIGHGQGYLQKW